jgi:imidazolonepropionase-like amidohydrolase
MVRHWFGIALSIALASVLTLSALAADSPKTIRYTIRMAGNVAGSEVDSYFPDGHVESAFEYNDRGRGPKITARYEVRPDGLISRSSVTGQDYLHAQVDEQFTLTKDVGQWKSKAEKGEAKGPGFYSSLNGTPVEGGLMVAALLHSKSGAVKLFPGGEAKIEKMTDQTLESGERKVHVTLYGITGISFTPVTVWVDDEGRFFGTPGKWFSVLPEGWDGVNDQLYQVELKASDERYSRLGKTLAVHPKGAVAFEHVNVFASLTASVVRDQTVVVEGERIQQVGASASVRVPEGAQRIDGKGKTLLPGLFDMHVHIGADEGLLNIASGVTTVRDMGNDLEQLEHLQDRWTKEEAIGPRVWKAGFIDGKGKYQAPTGIFVETQDEAVKAVDLYADKGFVQIKVYSSLNPAFVPAIVKEAHARGLRVSGHVPNGMIARQFVEEGADELQHINFIFLNFLADKVKDTRTPERFTAVGQYAAKLDLNSPEVNDFVKLLKDKRTTVDVTLAAFEGMFTGRPGVASPDWAPVLNRLPAQVQRGAFTGGLEVTPETDQLYKDSYTAMLRMTKKMYDAGIPILVGTDATAGLMLHRELEMEVKAGIPAGNALQNATLVAAGVLKQTKDLGSIAQGKLADLLLVEGDPTADISNIRRCRIVMKNGTMYNSADLYSAVGIAPAK